ncbi:MAG: sulfurtransferase-like selenium metabolism protein YedF [Deltaproteobacteria bacterium]|nr:sulfurtransferase-like selenium metabolism protein YedF [Deltaproteobacteria bacterium]
MIDELDCRGLGCPAPVLQVRNILIKEAPDSITVLVDNEAAVQNVSRFLEHQNFQVTTEIEGTAFRVIGRREDGVGTSGSISSAPVVKESRGVKKIMVLITSIHMGHGDDGLGDMLMFNFIKTLKEMGPDLWRVAFVNSGVSFTVEGSEAVPILKELAGEGVQILACGACLVYLHLMDKLQVGEVSNMLDIVTSMQLADTVVTI